ncbi:ArsR family transcriptional regulator [Natrialbaceae archaeon GCM10025810]|uniref:ArsR family transcriptional regulator n=1 Tax=Halovalidus salilacus TaxID=3075124 RepID=UPI00360E1A33
MSYNLTPAQRNVFEQLPATVSEVADALGITESTVRDHLSAINEQIPIINRDGVRYPVTELRRLESHPTNYNQTANRASKASQTKAANQHLADLNDRLTRLLDRSVPAVADGGLAYDPSNEDVVIHRSDDHIGAEVYDEFGNLVFNKDIAAERIRSVTDSVMDLIDREEKADRQFDTAHLLLGGDTVTGENIFSHQPHEIDLTIDAQIDLACELYFEQIQRLAARFDSVQVVCQAGNHGELRANGMSQEANADRIVYMMLDRMVRLSDLDNVTFIRSGATAFINFTMRNGLHRGHLRHGQNCLPHIGTASGQNKWRGWQIKHGFDIAYRGHYHEFKLEHVMNRPVLMSGSICPPSDYEESLSVWSEPAATVHGVTDDYPLAWLYPVQFRDTDSDAPDPALDGQSPMVTA